MNPAGDRGARLEHFLAPPVHPWRRRRALLERRARGTRAGEAEGVNRWKCFEGVLEELRVSRKFYTCLGVRRAFTQKGERSGASRSTRF